MGIRIEDRCAIRAVFPNGDKQLWKVLTGATLRHKRLASKLIKKLRKEHPNVKFNRMTIKYEVQEGE